MSSSLSQQNASMVSRLLDRWQLTAEQRAAILALGDTEAERQALFSQLLDVHRMLRLLFPANRELAYRWMTSGNRAFDGLMPIEMVERDGNVGLKAVSSYLKSFVAPI